MCLVVVMALCFVACQPTNPEQKENTAIIITANSELMAEMSGNSLKDYLDLLVKKGELTYGLDSFGMVGTINGITVDSSKHEFWLICSSDTENTSDWKTYEHDGVTYRSTNYGIFDMPVKAGETYVFVISTY